MDFPCTQLLVDDFDESGLSESTDKRRIGTLIVNEDTRLGIDKDEFPVYEGDNIIGRHENCDISIPLGVALSKKHACIEADKTSCYIYDCGSSNKTRLGNLRLKAEVRYCLQDGNSIAFANIKCVYKELTGQSEIPTFRASLSSPQLLAVDTPVPSAQRKDTKHLNESISSEIVPDSQPYNQSFVTDSIKDVEEKIDTSVNNNEADVTELKGHLSFQSTENHDDVQKVSIDQSDSDTDLEDTMPCAEFSQTNNNTDSDETDVEEAEDIVIITETPRTSFVTAPDLTASEKKDEQKGNEIPSPPQADSSDEDSDFDEEYSFLPATRTQLIVPEVKNVGYNNTQTNSAIVDVLSPETVQQPDHEKVLPDKPLDVTISIENTTRGSDLKGVELKEAIAEPGNQDTFNSIIVEQPAKEFKNNEAFEINFESQDRSESKAELSSVQDKPQVIKKFTDDALPLSDSLRHSSDSSVQAHCLTENDKTVLDTSFGDPVTEGNCENKLDRVATPRSEKIHLENGVTEKPDADQELQVNAPNDKEAIAVSERQATASEHQDLDLVPTQDCSLKSPSFPKKVPSHDAHSAGQNTLRSDTFEDDLLTQPYSKEASSENSENADVNTIKEDVSAPANYPHASKEDETTAAEAFLNGSLQNISGNAAFDIKKDAEGDKDHVFDDINTNMEDDHPADQFENITTDKVVVENRDDSSEITTSPDIPLSVSNSNTIADKQTTIHSNSDPKETNQSACLANQSAGEVSPNLIISKITAPTSDSRQSEVLQDLAQTDTDKECSTIVSEAKGPEKIFKDSGVSINASLHEKPISAAVQQDLSSLLPRNNGRADLSIYNLILPDSYISDGGDSDDDIFHSTPTSDVDDESYACAETQPFCGAGSSNVPISILPAIPEQLKTTSTPLKSFSNLLTPNKQVSPPFVSQLSISPNCKISDAPEKEVIPRTKSKRKGRGKNSKLDSDIYEYTASKKPKPSSNEDVPEERATAPPSRSRRKTTILPTLVDTKQDTGEISIIQESFAERSTRQTSIQSNNNGESNIDRLHVSTQPEPKPVSKRTRQKSPTPAKNSPVAKSCDHLSKNVSTDNTISPKNRRNKRRTTRASKLDSSPTAVKKKCEEYDGYVSELHKKLPNTRNAAKRKNENVSSESSSNEGSKLVEATNEKILPTRKSRRLLPASESSPGKSTKHEQVNAEDASKLLSSGASSVDRKNEDRQPQRKLPSRKARPRLAKCVSDRSPLKEIKKSNELQTKRRKTYSNTAASIDVDCSSGADLNEKVIQSAALALRPRRIKPKVMFTGVIDKFGEGIVKELGGHLTDDLHDCTHLVADKMRRTVKFLCAVVRGIHIVTQEWLRKSKELKRFLAEDDFELSEDALSQSSTTIDSPFSGLEHQYHFKLTDALTTARSRALPLFHGYRIHVTGNVLPPPEQMYQIIECGGGKRVAKLPKTNKLDVIVVSTEEDEKLCSTANKSGISVVDKEFILTGILRQKLELRKHRLFKNLTTKATPRTTATSRTSVITTRNRNAVQDSSMRTPSDRNTRSKGRRRRTDFYS